jgi:polysaccharide biosynthesis protein PslH
VVLMNYLAERRSVRFSDKLVCLSARDSHLLARLYGRGATHVSPIAVRDVSTVPVAAEQLPPDGSYALFVGGAFYANRDGIAWFAKHVAPRVNIPTYVVGYGMEDMRAELEQSGNIRVVGGVGSLAPWYAKARFVVAPIFDGSGMKTKVAEALMFGKRVIGTPEAFSGYDIAKEQAGACCHSADEFVAAIARMSHAIPPPFDPALRAIYDATYSFEAATTRLRRIICDAVNNH